MESDASESDESESEEDESEGGEEEEEEYAGSPSPVSKWSRSSPSPALTTGVKQAIRFAPTYTATPTRVNAPSSAPSTPALQKAQKIALPETPAVCLLSCSSLKRRSDMST